MMSKRQVPLARTKRELVEQVGIAVRKMGAQSVVTSKTVADRFSLNQTDLEVLDLILLRGKASAGNLADATGLSSGSVTALLDRLERAGYVERFDDPNDRRRVLVGVCPRAIKPIEEVYRVIQAKMVALWSTFEPDELRIVCDFITRSTDLAVECCKNFHGSRPRGRRTKVRSPAGL
jgi:DNA-binding MarR family transcriptional regulator